MWREGADIFRTNEIHFNSLGNFMLYKSVRGAIYQASRLCQPHYIAVSLCTCMYVSSYCVLIFVRTHCLCPQFTQGILGNRALGCGSSDDHPPSHLASRLGGTVATLLQASLAPSTRLMYERSWRKITNFLVFLGLSQQLPVAVSTLLLFVAHLHELRYSPASIQSIMSAVSYFHKAHNLFDPTRAFLISKAIIGARNLSQSVDIRLPVTPSVLSKLVASTIRPLPVRWQQ